MPATYEAAAKIVHIFQLERISVPFFQKYDKRKDFGKKMHLFYKNRKKNHLITVMVPWKSTARTCP